MSLAPNISMVSVTLVPENFRHPAIDFFDCLHRLWGKVRGHGNMGILQWLGDLVAGAGKVEEDTYRVFFGQRDIDTTDA